MSRDNSSRRSGNGGSKPKKFMETFVVGPFRMAFAALLEPEEDDYGNERYKMTCLFPPDSKDIKKIEDALYDAMEDGFGKDDRDWPTGRNDVHPKDKFYDAGTKKYAGFKEGWMALAVSSQEPPGIVDADKNEVISKREVYSGRWARAQITITWYDNKSKGVTAYLNHVQLLDHDEAFSGRGDASDAFDKYELKDRGERRGRDDEDDRDNRRGNSRDDERGRSGREGRSRDRDEDREEGRRGRGRDRDDDRENDRDSRRGRDDEDDRQESRSRGRGRDRDDEDDRDSRRGSNGRGRGRDEEEDDRRPSSRGRDRDEEDDRRPSRSRSRDDDRDDTRGSRNSRSRERASADEDWN